MTAIATWLAAPAPAARLAVMRILIGAFAVVTLLVRLPVLWAMGDEPPGRWDPVGVLWWLDSPLGSTVVRAAIVLAVLLGALFAAGVAHRAIGPAFALVLLFVTTYRSSGGQLLWFDDLLVLHALVVGFAPGAADVHALRRRHDPVPPPSARHGFPLRLAAIATVVTYALAGVAKVRIGGAAWLDGDSLRNHVAYSATRLRVLGGTPSPLAAPLTRASWLLPALALATLVIELGAPVVLVLRRARWPWVMAAWSMHAAIAATMFVVFPYPLALVAFAPLFRLELLGERFVRIRASLAGRTRP